MSTMRWRTALGSATCMRCCRRPKLGRPSLSKAITSPSTMADRDPTSAVSSSSSGYLGVMSAALRLCSRSGAAGPLT